MQSVDEMIGGLSSMLSQYDVVEITGSTVGFVVRLKSAEHVQEVSTRFPRYRGMSVRVEVAQMKYLFLGVEATPNDGTYVAKRGVFTALVAQCVTKDKREVWAPKLFVVPMSEHTRPLGAIDLPFRRSIQGAFRAAEKAARAYQRAARKSVK